MLKLQEVFLEERELILVILKVEKVHVELNNLLCVLVQEVLHFELGIVRADQRCNIGEMLLRFFSLLNVGYFITLFVDLILGPFVHLVFTGAEDLLWVLFFILLPLFFVVLLGERAGARNVRCLDKQVQIIMLQLRKFLSKLLFEEDAREAGGSVQIMMLLN